MEKPEFNIKSDGLEIAPFEGVDPMPTLVKVVKLLRKTGFKFYVSSGTALGIYRDKKFIPHDTDLDISIIADWDTNIQKEAVALIQDFYNNDLVNVLAITSKDKPVQVAFLDEKNSNVLVDLEFYYKGIIKNKAVHFKVDGHIDVSDYKVKDFEFQGHKLPLAYPYNAYMFERYGSDWGIPMEEKGDWQKYTKALHPWQVNIWNK